MCVLGWGFFVEVSEDLRQATTFCKGIAAKQMRAWTSMNLFMVLAVPYINILFWVKSSEILCGTRYFHCKHDDIMTNFWCVFHHFRTDFPTRRCNRRQSRWTRSFVLQRILFGHLRICYDTSNDGSEDRHLCCLVLQDAKWYVLHGFISFSWGGWCDQLRVVMFSVNSQIADITSLITLRRCSTNFAS